MDAVGRIGVTEDTGQTAHRSVHGKRPLGRPQGKFTLLPEATSLRTAGLFVPHDLPAPDPVGTLECIRKAWCHTPVDKHHQYRPRLTDPVGFGEPFGAPVRPAALVLLVAGKIRQRLVRTHAAVLLVGGAVLGRLASAAAGIGRVGDDRVKHSALKGTHEVQHIPVQNGPAVTAAVFHSQFCVLVHDQIQFIGFTQRHHPFFLSFVI